MQINPNHNSEKPGTKPDHSQATNLSLSDFLPDIFEGDAPSFQAQTSSQVKAIMPPIAVGQTIPDQSANNAKANNWVAANFEQSNTNGLAGTASQLKPDPVSIRLRRQIPFLNKIRPGPWLVVVAAFVSVIVVLLLLGWLYLNNIIGAVPPSNGPLDTYPGANRLEVDQNASNMLFEIEKNLPNLPGAISVPSVSGDKATTIAGFYSHLMATKGYTALSPQSQKTAGTINTTYGSLSVFYYTKNSQIARVELVTLVADIPQNHLKKGDTLIILATAYNRA